MSRLEQQFAEQDRQRINAAVAEAEAQTSAQIVPVVAATSGRYDRAEDIFGLLLGIAAAAAVWFFVPDAQPGSDSWAGHTPATKIAFMAGALVAGFALGAVVASRAWSLRRPFTPRKEMRDNVARAAAAAFFNQSLHQTRAGTGLLVYLSMYEHRAVVLADEAVLGVLGQPALDALCRDLTDLLADTNATETLCQTIRRVGRELGDGLPRADDSTDEISNELVLLG